MADSSAPAMEVEGDSTASGVASLVEMGFDEERAKIALNNCSGNVEQAMELLVSKDGEDIEATSGDKSEAPKEAKSIRCVDTGKLFRNMNAAMIYAERTGNTNFEECDIEIPPLTEEEKAQKVKELKERIKQKRSERAEKEKQEEIQREKQRRQGGQEMNAIREEHERLRREREYELRKKEKEDAKIHREQLKRQIAEDKAERAADKAFKDGKDPKAAYKEAFDRAMGKGTGGKSKDKATTSEAKVKEAIGSLLTYRAGGDGLKALGILKKLIGNPLNKPDEEKFRTVKLSNETIRKKVATLRGGVGLLKAVGFKKKEGDEEILILEDEVYDKELLENALGQIEDAIASN